MLICGSTGYENHSRHTFVVNNHIGYHSTNHLTRGVLSSNSHQYIVYLLRSFLFSVEEGFIDFVDIVACALGGSIASSGSDSAKLANADDIVEFLKASLICVIIFIEVEIFPLIATRVAKRK